MNNLLISNIDQVNELFSINMKRIMHKKIRSKSRRSLRASNKSRSKLITIQHGCISDIKSFTNIKDKYVAKLKDYFLFSESMFYNREFLSWNLSMKISNTILNNYQFHFKMPTNISWKQFNYHKLIGQGSFGKGFIASLRNSSENVKNRKLKICLIKMIGARRGDDVQNHYSQLINERDSLIRLSGTWTPKLYACFIERKLAAIFVQEFIDGETITYIKKLIKIDNGTDLYVLLMSTLQNEDNIKNIPVLTQRQFEIIQFYVAELLGALKFMHDHGVLHRDLKENNILLTCSGHLKLIDFGLAKRKCSIYEIQQKCSYSSSCSSSHLLEPYLSTSHRMWGNRYYAAPEYISEEKRIFDDKGDYWAVGIIVFHLIFGCRPYQHIISDKVKELSDYIINWKVKSFMQKCILKQRCKRHPELIKAFYCLISDERSRLHDGLIDANQRWQPQSWPLLENFNLLKMYEYSPPIKIPSNKKMYSLNNHISLSVIAKSFTKEKYTEHLDCPYFNYVSPVNNDLFDDVTVIE